MGDRNMHIYPSDSSGTKKEMAKYPTTYFDSLTHLFRCTVGAGIFAMGDAFKNSGLLLGCILTVFVGIINVHCQHILLTCSEEYHKLNPENPPPDYATTVEICFQSGSDRLKAWAKTLRRTINSSLCVMQLGFCAVYFVFVSRNIQQIFKAFDFELDIHIYMAIILIPIILECLIKNLKFMAPLSSVANVLMMIGLVITFYYASQDLVSIKERKLFGDLQNLPLFFGTAIYAFVSIGLVIPLKNEMKEPALFQKSFGVLNVGISFVAVLMITAGFLGYWKWGDDVKGSMTLNLPQGSGVTYALQGILASAILLTLPIQFYVPVDIIWPSVKEKYGPFKNETLMELIIRIGLVLITFTMAEVIPRLSIFISLVGATCSISVALIFPAILDLVYKSQQSNKIGWFTIVKDVFILLLGVVGSVTGTYEGLHALVNEFRN